MQLHSDFRQVKRFEALDGLRAISILAVIWHHTAPKGLPQALVHFGASGVTLFFAISGFLITTLLLRERDRQGTIDLKAFYWRRFFRILPLYFGVLAIYAVLVAVLEKGSREGMAFWSNLPYFMTFTSNLFVPLDGRTIFYFAWSLAAEEQFYLIWPALLFLVTGLRRLFWLTVVIFVLLSVAGLYGAVSPTMIPWAIVMGSILAIGLHGKASYAVLARVMQFSWMPAVWLLLFLVAAFRAHTPPIVVHGCAAALVCCAIIQPANVLRPFLNLPLVTYVGSISYGMYMLHMLGKNLVTKGLAKLGFQDPGLWVFVLTTLVATLLAGLSFRYFESRVQRWGAAWVAVRKARA